MKKAKTGRSRSTSRTRKNTTVPALPPPPAKEEAYTPIVRIGRNGGIVCPWCEKVCDAGFRCPVIAKPCKHVGCMDCVRRAVAPAAMNQRKAAICPVCKELVRTFTIDGAPLPYQIEKGGGEEDDEKDDDDDGDSKGKEEDDGGDKKEEFTRLKQRIEALNKELDELKDDGGVKDMDLGELKQLQGTEPNDDWSCMVCSFNYDNASRLPMCVAECYAIAADHHQPKMDRGLAPGCGHSLCESCMMHLLGKGDPICYTCRSYVKGFAVNVPLVRAIASFKNGYYLHLVLQLNDSANKQNEMVLEVRKLKEEYAGFDQLKEKVTRLEKQVATLEASAALLGTQRAEYYGKWTASSAQVKRLDQDLTRATKRLQATMSINKVLFDEAGTMARSQLGIEHPLEGRQDPDKVVLNIQSRDRKTTMYYGRKRKELSPEERGSVQRIEQYNDAEMDDLFDDAEPPKVEDVRQSWMVIGGPNQGMDGGQPQHQQTLVLMGSWLHERIMSKNNTVEATFDAPPPPPVVMEEVAAEGPMKMYCVVSRDALESALVAYERLVKEAAERPKEKDKEEEEGLNPAETMLDSSMSTRDLNKRFWMIYEDCVKEISREMPPAAQSEEAVRAQAIVDRVDTLIARKWIEFALKTGIDMQVNPPTCVKPACLHAAMELAEVGSIWDHRGSRPMPQEYYGRAVSPVQHVGNSQSGMSYAARGPDAPREENYYQSLIDAHAAAAAVTDYSDSEPIREDLQTRTHNGLEILDAALTAGVHRYASRIIGRAMNAPVPLPPGAAEESLHMPRTYPNHARYNRMLGWNQGEGASPPPQELVADDEQRVEEANNNDRQRAPESVFDM